MGKAKKGDSLNFSGKIGNKVYVQRKNGTVVVYEAPATPSIPQRTEAQLQHRLQFTNLAAVNTQFHQTLKKGFEGIGNTMSDFNAFVQCNINVVKVYIPKQVRLNGGSVLAPYQITRGKLASIAYTKNGNGILVSDILVGTLVIDENTTVADFSAAVIAWNEDWAEFDQLTFFYGIQTLDTVTHIPRAKISGFKVVLDLSDDTLLYDVVTALGFTTVDGKLGMNMEIEDGAAAWIHSRENGSNLSVSTQYLYVDSSVLAAYQTNTAFTISADSYGGVNQSAVFLQPKGNKTRTVQILPETTEGENNGTTNSGTTNSGNNGNGESSNTGNNNGNSGGSNTSGTNGTNNGGTGSVTPSVPKLTISRTGTGTSTVTANGEGVTSGSEVAAGTEVSISVTPAEGTTPTASLNGSTVTLTESDGVYNGTFSMPSANATLVINSGGTTGGGSGDMN